ncbi:DUF115 domain-containing protein [Puniceicoccaceae bacterium K14]|nr:DUF115 domain-containing protein [Puniceicoccaceae bacterium K14]
MKVWEDDFPLSERFIAVLRYRRAHKEFFERPYWGRNTISGKYGLVRRKGYHGRLGDLTAKHTGKRCFIVANGPSLAQLDLAKLRSEVVIASNGAYKIFNELGFSPTYYTMEDARQIEDRRKALPEVRGSTRIFPLRSSYCIKPREDTIFCNLEKESYPSHRRYRELYPLFSEDFASTVYLGSTVTYFNLQLAFHLGCDSVYLIGLDHDYGEVVEKLPPGKVKITPEVYEMIKDSHFAPGYHKIGGYIGVPYVKYQEQAFKKAKSVFAMRGRKVYNASAHSKLDVFERVDYASLF